MFEGRAFGGKDLWYQNDYTDNPRWKRISFEQFLGKVRRANTDRDKRLLSGMLILCYFNLLPVLKWAKENTTQRNSPMFLLFSSLKSLLECHIALKNSFWESRGQECIALPCFWVMPMNLLSKGLAKPSWTGYIFSFYNELGKLSFKFIYFLHLFSNCVFSISVPYTVILNVL